MLECHCSLSNETIDKFYLKNQVSFSTPEADLPLARFTRYNWFWFGSEAIGVKKPIYNSNANNAKYFVMFIMSAPS